VGEGCDAEHGERVRDPQPLETTELLDAVRQHAEQPFVLHGSAGVRGVEQWIGGEPRPAGRVCAPHREVPPQVVGQDRPGREQQQAAEHGRGRSVRGNARKISGHRVSRECPSNVSRQSRSARVRRLA